MTQPSTFHLPSAEVALADCKLSDQARLLMDGQTAINYFSLLSRQRMYDDALRVAAYVLSKRDAVWWGCLCLWQAYRPKPPEKEAAVLKAALKWVREPGEELRRHIEELGKAAGIGTPGGLLAQAVFLSGGSISRPKLPEVEPKPHLTAKSVANAVLIAVTKLPRPQRPDCQRHFLKLAEEVLFGRLHWREEPDAESPG